MVKGLIEEMEISVPVALHLDHGMSVDRCKKAIDAGFTSVMIDGSHYPIEENIAMTKQVVEYAYSRQVSVEAEVGTIGGMEDALVGGIRYADPNECLRIVKEAQIDALAPALVLHGGSGIPVYQIQKAIDHGHAKINVNTDCIKAWANAIREVLAEDELVYEPKAIITPAKEAMIEIVKGKMREFKTSNKV